MLANWRIRSDDESIKACYRSTGKLVIFRIHHTCVGDFLENANPFIETFLALGLSRRLLVSCTERHLVWGCSYNLMSTIIDRDNLSVLE